MKRLWKLLLLVVAGIVLVACGNTESETSSQGSDTEGSDTEETTQESGSEEPLEVLLLVQQLGDMSFNDSAQAGINAAQEEFGDQIETNVIEYGADPAAMEPSLLDAADAGYNVIVVPSQFVDLVSQYAPEYPDTQFWLFDTTFDHESGDYPNVYAITYRANEASYLGGYLAASMSETGTLGFLGGMDNNIINDFLVGYAEGAQAANPEVSILSSFVGAWDDSAKGKELGLSMYGQDASMVFNVAGGSGVGLIEAGVEQGNHVLGVDSDQAMMYHENGQEDYASVIPTSVLKNVGDSLHRAISLQLSGELAVGETETLGLVEGGVGLADNQYYEEMVPEELRTEIAEIEQQIIDGEIEVGTSYDMTSEEIEEFRNGLTP